MSGAPRQRRDPLKNLEVVADFVSTYVQRALQVALIEMYTLGLFNSNKEFYRTHPANNLYGVALHALAQQSLVRVDAVLQSRVLQPLPGKIRRKFDLLLHRNKIAHPLEVRWKPAMAKFVQERRDVYDYRPALIWDMQRSINDELRARGMRVYNETITVTWDMAVAVEIMTRASLKPESAHLALPAAQVLPYLQSLAPEYLKELEKRPDGKRPRPPAPSAS